MKKDIVIFSDNKHLSNFIFIYLTKLKINFKIFHTKKYLKINKKRNRSKLVNLRNKNFLKLIVQNSKILISLNCHSIFPKFLTDNVTCVNFHPGFNPFNRGLYPQIFSIINKKPCGVTVHLMTNKIDQGPIIEQKKVIIKNTDTSYEVYKNIIKLQKYLIKKNIYKLINGKFKLFERKKIKGNYNSKKKFKKLCKLNLNKKSTLGEHIKLLRALSHKGFKNAYYTQNKKKIYLELKLFK
jgi:methionyl-tRNA formyltransferase